MMKPVASAILSSTAPAARTTHRREAGQALRRRNPRTSHSRRTRLRSLRSKAGEYSFIARPPGGRGVRLERGQTARIHPRGERFVQEPDLRVDRQEGNEGGFIELAPRQGFQWRLRLGQEVEGPEQGEDPVFRTRGVGLVEA